MGGTIEQKVANIVEPIIKAKGLELVDVEYVKEGAHWYLRLYIDKEGGVDLDDCTDVSNAVNDILDHEDIISQAYMLEVSSPGVERPLKKAEDFERFKGELITIHTSKPVQGFLEFTGNLIGLINEEIILEYEGKRIAIPWGMVQKAHLAFVF